MDILGWGSDFLLVLLGSAALLAVGLNDYVFLASGWVYGVYLGRA